MQNYASLKVSITMTQNMQLIISPTNNIRAKVVVQDPIMAAVAPVCKWCKPNLDNHAPPRCSNREPPTKEHCLTYQYDTSHHRNWSNGHSYPVLQLFVSTTKPDHISELLEATREMTRYFKKSYKNGKSHQVNTDNNHSCKSQNNSYNPDKYVHRTNSNSNHVNQITGQSCSLKGTKPETVNTIDHHDSNSPDSSFSTLSYSEWLSGTDKVTEVTTSDMNYAANFPVAINHNRTIFVFDTRSTISCMSKSCFDKLQPQPLLVQTSAYRVNCADGNSLVLCKAVPCLY